MKNHLTTALQHLKRAFPFIPDPEMSDNERYMGIITHPGFHTTTDIDIAAAYAAGRVLNTFTDEDDAGVAFVTDYPVVAVVDTGGADKHTDYDADNFTMAGLTSSLDALRDAVDENSSNEEIRNAAYEYVEFSEEVSELGAYSTPMEYFSERVFKHFTNPLNEEVINHPDFPDAVRNYFKTGTWSHANLLLSMTDQYRYTVPIDNLVGVYYVTPVANASVDYESDEEDLDKKWPGFSVAWVDDLYGDTYAPDYEIAWGADPGGLEYHGTTYHRLQQAFPDIDFPSPPNPPYTG